MGMHCEICQKEPVRGNSIARRGKAKYLGGIGRKTTGISRRMFKPNLQNIKIMDKDGTVRRARVCVKCIRSGLVQRPVKQKPFQIPRLA